MAQPNGTVLPATATACWPPPPTSILLQIAAAKRQLKQDSVDTEWSSSPGISIHWRFLLKSTANCHAFHQALQGFGPFSARHLTSFENGNSPGLNDHKSAWFSHPIPLLRWSVEETQRGMAKQSPLTCLRYYMIIG